MKKAPKKIKAWAVLDYPDKKPIIFGPLRGREGSMAVFKKKEDAKKMQSVAALSWTVVECEIILKQK